MTGYPVQLKSVPETACEAQKSPTPAQRPSGADVLATPEPRAAPRPRLVDAEARRATRRVVSAWPESAGEETQEEQPEFAVRVGARHGAVSPIPPTAVSNSEHSRSMQVVMQVLRGQADSDGESRGDAETDRPHHASMPTSTPSPSAPVERSSTSTTASPAAGYAASFLGLGVAVRETASGLRCTVSPPHKTRHRSTTPRHGTSRLPISLSPSPRRGRSRAKRNGLRSGSQSPLAADVPRLDDVSVQVVPFEPLNTSVQSSRSMRNRGSFLSSSLKTGGISYTVVEPDGSSKKTRRTAKRATTSVKTKSATTGKKRSVKKKTKKRSPSKPAAKRSTSVRARKRAAPSVRTRKRAASEDSMRHVHFDGKPVVHALEEKDDVAAPRAENTLESSDEDTVYEAHVQLDLAALAAADLDMSHSAGAAAQEVPARANEPSIVVLSHTDQQRSERGAIADVETILADLRAATLGSARPGSVPVVTRTAATREPDVSTTGGQENTRPAQTWMSRIGRNEPETPRKDGISRVPLGSGWPAMGFASRSLEAARKHNLDPVVFRPAAPKW